MSSSLWLTLRRNAGAVTLRMTYGYKIESYTEEDHFITLAEELAGITTKASEPGYWLVDTFPSCLFNSFYRC